MKNLKFISFFFCLLILSCKAKEKEIVAPPVAEVKAPVMVMDTLTSDEISNGWQLLFDGVSTKGWHSYGGAPVNEAWQIQDGSLMLNAGMKKGHGGGDIVSDAEFQNFHLKLEWKIDTCGNSGIIFFVHEDTAKFKQIWHTGPEMQVLDNKCHPDAKIIKHRAGDLYDLISSSKETVKPALEWNQAEIVSQNGALDLYLNGEKVVSTVIGNAAWKKMVAGSKFKPLPGFASFPMGHIALQDHGNNVWYRHIKVKAL